MTYRQSFGTREIFNPTFMDGRINTNQQQYHYMGRWKWSPSLPGAKMGPVKLEYSGDYGPPQSTQYYTPWNPTSYVPFDRVGLTQELEGAGRYIGCRHPNKYYP